MQRYCKAYHLKDLRQFGDWSEKPVDQELSDETICYVWDDFTVVLSPIQDSGVLFNTITPAWQAFLQNILHFMSPAELEATNQQAEE